MVPTIQGYEDAGDFTVKARLRTSIHGNLVFYLSLGAVAIVGLILLVILHKDWFASHFRKDLYLLEIYSKTIHLILLKSLSFLVI